MRYKQFYPGDSVMLIDDYDGIPSGTTGKVSSRWIGTAYVVRLPDGTFRWLDSREIGPSDPGNLYPLKEGDIGVVISEEHQHDYAKLGTEFQILKVINDLDYYGVLINNKLEYIGGFRLVSI